MNHPADFGPLPDTYPGPKAEKQVNLELVKALRRLLAEAERGDALFFVGVSVGPACETTEYMILQPGPAECIVYTFLGAAQAKIISNVIRAQGAPQKPSPIIKPR